MSLDGSAKLETNWEFNSPDFPFKPTVSTKIEIPAVIRGRAEASMVFWKVKKEMGVKSGISGEAKVGLDASLKLAVTAEIMWTGIDGYIIAKASPTDDEESDLYHCVDE